MIFKFFHFYFTIDYLLPKIITFFDNLYLFVKFKGRRYFLISNILFEKDFNLTCKFKHLFFNKELIKRYEFIQKVRMITINIPFI